MVWPLKPLLINILAGETSSFEYECWLTMRSTDVNNNASKASIVGDRPSIFLHSPQNYVTAQSLHFIKLHKTFVVFRTVSVLR